MHSLNAIFRIMLLTSTLFCSAFADENYIVEHVDPITIDSQLTLPELIDLSLQNYPQGMLLPALKQEAEALHRRGDSWVAGALTATFFYRDGWVSGATDTGAPEIAGAIEVPLWNWGQRAAGQQLAESAKKASHLQADVIKLQFAGLVRAALWDMQMANNRHVITKRVYALSRQLVKTVKRRVDLGDLARTELLLAQTEQLSKRSELVQSEAEQMHARKRYTTLTQMTRIPSDFSEAQSHLTEINPQHPLLNSLNASIARKKAELVWVKSEGSGQATVAIGGNSQRGSPNASVETITLEVNVPFGGEAHLAPEIAAVNVQLSELIAQRNFVLRELSEAFHEAEHALAVDKSELEIAEQRRNIAETHLKMTQLSFAAGEINLLDLLKIQSRAHAAIRDAEEQKIILLRDIARYNQVLGLLP